MKKLIDFIRKYPTAWDEHYMKITDVEKCSSDLLKGVLYRISSDMEHTDDIEGVLDTIREELGLKYAE